MIRSLVTDADRAAFAAYNAGKPVAQQLAPVGGIAQLRSQYVNRAKVFISGYDFGLNYRLPALPVGRFTVSSDWSYLKDYYTIQGLGLPLDNSLGEDGAARLRGNLVVSWHKGPWSASVSGYYVGKFQDTTATTTAATYEALGRPSYLAQVYDKGVFNYRYIVNDTLTYNSSVSYHFKASVGKWLDGTTLRLSVNNLTDNEPPLSSDARGYPPAVYGSLVPGRMWALEITKTF
jgi:outer membrane receptor protein involved in Fe transport